MASNILPPSPAPSACDTLDGIDDLDAFLAARPLSMFPTPDLRDDELPSTRACSRVLRLTENLSAGHDENETSSHFAQAAQVLIEMTTRCTSAHPQDTTHLATLLSYAELPFELQGLAYAVVEALFVKGSIFDCESDLLLTAALALADIHINDRPYHLLTWTRLITTPIASIQQLDSTMLAVLRNLDWTFHRFCDPDVIAQHITTLTGGRRQQFPRLRTRHSSTALWVRGQLTPAGQSPSPQAQSKPTYFLPLL